MSEQAKWWMAAVAGLIMLGLASIHYVDKAKYEASQADLAKLQQKLDDANRSIADLQAHKYQLFNSGFRTFRLDTVTGQTCIQLTTEVDWRRADTASQSCLCMDFLARDSLPLPIGTKEVMDQWNNDYNSFCAPDK